MVRKTGTSARKCRESEGELFNKTEEKCVKMLGKQRKICKTRQFPLGEDAYSKVIKKTVVSVGFLRYNNQ